MTTVNTIRPHGMRTIHIVFVAILVVWVLLQWNLAVPDEIVNDWVGWRQADTQTIARNFLKPGSDILHPQINWGGSGPGYVECEFQLYTFLNAQVMKVVGEAEWPGQLLSLMAILLTTLVIYALLNHHFKNQFAAIIGAMVFLTSNGAVHLSTAVIPDSLCIFFYSLGLFMFFKYLSDQKNGTLILCLIFSTLAGLIKPLALNIGILQFIVVWFGHRQLLKSPKLWGAWLVIVAVVGSYMAFAYNLYLTYGNTFGVLGGESKFPTLHGLTVWIHYAKLAYMTVGWGLGPLGTLAALYLLIGRKLTHVEWALIIGNAAAILIPMRYTVNRGFSPHYYIFAALLGAWFVAYAVQLMQATISRPNAIRRISIAAAILIVMTYGVHLHNRMNPMQMHYNLSVTALGKELAAIAEPGRLAIVRSIANERERTTWGNRINNFEDPRVFYLANIRGWPLPADAQDPALIEKYVQQGANYFVDLYRPKHDSALYAWLDKHAEILFEADIGRIYRFNGSN